ncbi:MAG: hypothetical protein LBB24_00320 [Rickettsiales bacterium]|jgi:hypothetical protein|nr:hypothetical protein [Rickettsiales bacterium]
MGVAMEKYGICEYSSMFFLLRNLDMAIEKRKIRESREELAKYLGRQIYPDLSQMHWYRCTGIFDIDFIEKSIRISPREITAGFEW